MVEIDDQTPDFGGFGQELKRQREIRGISLKEIADVTKISRRFLEAIEKNDLDTLPAPVFTRGFIREYARYVGLDPSEMVAGYMESVRRREAAEEAAEPTLEHPIAAPSAPRTEEKPPQAKTIWSIIAIVALLVVVVIFFARRDATDEAERAVPDVTATQTATATVAPAEAPADAPQQPLGEELTMRIRAAEDSWVDLVADGETAVNQVIPAGSEEVVTARDRFEFRTIGNAGGIEITIDGTAMPSLGASGEVVRNVVFDREAVERQRQQPATTTR